MDFIIIHRVNVLGDKRKITIGKDIIFEMDKKWIEDTILDKNKEKKILPINRVSITPDKVEIVNTHH